MTAINKLLTDLQTNTHNFVQKSSSSKNHIEDHLKNLHENITKIHSLKKEIVASPKDVSTKVDMEIQNLQKTLASRKTEIEKASPALAALYLSLNTKLDDIHNTILNSKAKEKSRGVSSVGEEDQIDAQ